MKRAQFAAAGRDSVRVVEQPDRRRRATRAARSAAGRAADPYRATNDSRPCNRGLRNCGGESRLRNKSNKGRPATSGGSAAEKELDRLAAPIHWSATGSSKSTRFWPKCEACLREMHELEDFNKLLERLRGVMQKQQQLEQQTIRKQREDLEE